VENRSQARDVNGRDETETFKIFVKTRPRRDVDMSRDRLETETTTLGSPTRIMHADVTFTPS